eukprot:m.187548 g.187548  ORF g.187548 m.187548 type:complete len:364 (+) comp32310_c0_seq5:307-1398(+)
MAELKTRLDIKAIIAEQKAKMLAEREKRQGLKYVRKGDIERLEASRGDAATSKKRRVTGESQAPTHHVRVEEIVVEDANTSGVSKINLPETEIVRRLRLRREPVRLFGEDLQDVFDRLRELELHAPLDVIKDRQRNDFMRAMNEIENENVTEQVGGGEKSKSNTLTKAQVMEKLDEARAKVKLLPTGNDELDQKYIRLFLKGVFGTWNNYLEERNREMKWSSEGKNASATFRQTEEYVKPLFKHLKKRDTPVELIPLLVEIVKDLDQREYQQANDAYLRMAIGKAAWPIGVTQVGIHSRTGREKIFSQQIAHVLNDETQRKYIQGLKRMMTYMQMKWPSDPSKSMEYRAVVSQLYPSQACDIL